METLKESISRDGFLAPVLVRPITGGRYEVVSGNHRVMAARELGLKTVPCVVAKMDKRTAQRVAVNLNTIHGDLSAELLAPFLAMMDDETLDSVYLDDSMLVDIVEFDADLSERLARFEVPAAYDNESPTGPIAPCICPSCGKQHIRANPA